ncbi:MAG: TIGR01777 family protein [Anaerolineaceae bacterium]|nr:TIGR01777 family protein [Anaerolineaceae bacterium]
MTKRVILAGGSGFLGGHLEQALLDRNYEPVVLTRSPRKPNQVAWDGKTPGDWTQYLEGAAAVINFTGKSVNCRYTPANRREIVESRVDSVNVIHKAILGAKTPPSVLVQAASAAIYGDAGSQTCDETASPGKGFSVETCLAWEHTFNSIDLPETRKVLFRIGFALDKNGGALQPLLQLTRFFLGGAAGNGQQYISWLHIDDLNRMFIEAIENPMTEGMYNAVGPNPVTNAAFMRTLRQVVGRPWSPSVPAPFVRIGAFLMGTEGELVLTGRRCLPTRFLKQGFTFQYTDLEQTLTAILTQ